MTLSLSQVFAVPLPVFVTRINPRIARRAMSAFVIASHTTRGIVDDDCLTGPCVARIVHS
jgi:hypothetical protein